MEEKVTYSKEDKQLSVFGCIAAGAIFLTNLSFAFTRQEKFSAFLPLSVVLCAVSAVLDIIALAVLIKNFKGLTKKINYVIGLVFLTLICGWVCYMGVSAVKDMNEKRDTEAGAVLFIKDKYGIDAQAVGYSSYTYPSGKREETVKMTADGKEFTVKFLSSDETEKHSADDYQIDEIEQAVCDEVNRVYPGGILRGVGIHSDDFYFDRVVENYFDGTNLDEVMDGNSGGIIIDYAGTEFDLEDPLFEKLNNWHIQPYFVSFDTAAHLEEFTEKNEPGSVYIRDEQYAKYAPYITDRVEYNYNKETNEREIIRKSYDIKSGAEFDYLFREISENEKGAEKIEQRFAKYSETALGKPITKVYKREYSGSSSFFIFYPLEKLNGAANIEAAWISDSAGSNNAFGTQKAEVIWNYAVFVLPYYVEEFMIVDIGDMNDAS